MPDIDQVALQNIEAASSRIRDSDMHGPTLQEMLAAWKDFKETRLFATLFAHMEHLDKLLAAEGTIWGFFYNGYLAGYERTHKPLDLSGPVVTSDEIKMLLENPNGKETV